MDTLSICILIAAIVLVVGIVIYKFKKLGLRKYAIELISQAEVMAVQNSEKMDYCIDQFIKIIPAPFSLFITKEMIKSFIQKIFDEIKVALDTQKVENIDKIEK